ncbi:Uracil catabolism protein 4 [Rhizoctonia solani]|uniref:Uracil catabolism protein 4 n=1 Tax=Rhizoctonia solani TaxID=456999 RepID=A0A8H8P7C0_9AGAM|nr:Uracil catabolism protein 4 [Rhizoctonia solani]QRW25642.1 Uracil catabolism protein 4 [Rhizoctonia solani]
MTGSFGLPTGNSNGEPKGSVWTGRARVRGPLWAQLPLLTIGMLGLQIVWSVEMAYASPYLLSLGLKKSHMALVFVAGPLSGLIMQPLIGVLADRSTSSLGRRRPYMLAASLVSIGGLMLLGFTREFSGIFGGAKGLTIGIAVYAIFCIDFSINAVQAVDRALLVDILPPALQAAGNAWAGRMFGLGSVAGFFIGGINLPSVFPSLGRTQLEVLSVISSVLLLSLHGITAASVEEKVLVTDGTTSDTNIFAQIFKDIWENILTLPRTIRSICLVQFFSWIAWFPVLFYSSTWVGDIYKATAMENGRVEDDPTLHDDATRIGSLALLYSSILSFAVSIVAPFFIRSNRGAGSDAPRGAMDKLKISLGGLWSLSQGIFACSMMATLLPQTVTSATIIITITGFCWAVSQWVPFSLLGEAILLSAPDYTAVPHLEHAEDEIPLTDRRSRRRSSSPSPPRLSRSSSPTNPSRKSRSHTPSSTHSSSSSVRGEGSTPASALFSNDTARRSRPKLEKRVSGGTRNGTDDDFQRNNDGPVDNDALELEDGELEMGGDSGSTDEGVGSKAGIILGIHNLVVVLPQFLVTGLSAVLFALFEPHRSVLHGKHPGNVPPGTNITLPLNNLEIREEEKDASSDSIAKEGKLEYFDYHPEKEKDVVEFCAKIIEREFGSAYDTIPPHSRWRHFDAGHERIAPLLAQWSKELTPLETTKRLIDLFLVSVLLDAGAGNALDMFLAGFFSSDGGLKVDAAGLKRITPEKTGEAMQVSASNPMSGLEGRSNLLANLGGALSASPEIFGSDGRPGNLLEFIEKQGKSKNGKTYVHMSALWHVLIEGLAPIWPATRTQLGGTSLGDVWPCSALHASEGYSKDTPGSDLVPFHKLSQWLAYSLVEPIEKVLGWKIEGMEDMTGLPEYRNGGLLVDLGVLTLRKETVSSFYPNPEIDIARLAPSHPAIIEWRAMTVIELDRIAEALREHLNAPNLALAQVLESATWKGGREIAKQKRPETAGPPIEIESDGTVF